MTVGRQIAGMVKNKKEEQLGTNLKVKDKHGPDHSVDPIHLSDHHTHGAKMVQTSNRKSTKAKEEAKANKNDQKKENGQADGQSLTHP